RRNLLRLIRKPRHLAKFTQSSDKVAKEGAEVELQCQHNIPAGNYDSVYWYLQKTNQKLTYVHHGFQDITEVGRYQINVDRKKCSSKLIIRNVYLSDMAVYYCALQGHCDSCHAQHQTKTACSKMVADIIELTFYWGGG
uniref:Ig-like domain-containing protein n=1 Tax=Vombatus ursinus TaxID=29139 RepID=A0A4X2LYM8_VOMUR